MESNVDTFACPCMFDCPARMNTFSGLAAAWLAVPDIRPRTTAMIMNFTLCPMFLMACENISWLLVRPQQGTRAVC